MKTFKPQNKTIRPIQISITVLTLVLSVLGQGCSPSHLEGSTSSDIPRTTISAPIQTRTPETIETPTATLVYLPTSEITQNTIYFWWLSGGKGELWRLKPNGDSNILYAVNIEHTLEEIVSDGLLSENSIKTIKEYMAANPNETGDNKEEPMQIIPISLMLSSDKKRLAWEEQVGYCPPPVNDTPTCIAENLIRVFDLETNELQITVNAKTTSAEQFQPAWSPNNQHLAFMGEDLLIKILDTKFSTVDTVGTGGKFTWFPDGNSLIIETKTGFDAFGPDNGIQIYDLHTKQKTDVFVNQGDILELAVSPNGKTLAYTYFNPGESDLLFVVDLITGKSKPITTRNEYGAWIYNVQWLSNDQILYIQQSQDSTSYSIYIRDAETDNPILSEEIPGHIKSGSVGRLSSDGTKVLFYGYSDSYKSSFMIFDIATQNWSFVPITQVVISSTKDGYELINNPRDMVW